MDSLVASGLAGLGLTLPLFYSCLARDVNDHRTSVPWSLCGPWQSMLCCA